MLRPPPWSYLILTGRVASIAGVLYAISLTDAWEFLGLRQAGLAPARRGAGGTMGLITSGLYGRVRHPMYFFTLGILWFAPEMTVLRLALYTTFTIYLCVGSRFEERRMVRWFGDAYLEYRRRVPGLVPFPWSRPAKPPAPQID